MNGEIDSSPTNASQPAVAMVAEGEPPSPMLDEATRMLVRRILTSRVLTLAEIKGVVASLMTDSTTIDSERLLGGLQNAGLLTHWQASKLLAGKSRGFFLGAYELLRPLGRGGMGMVYLGEHRVMKRQMALKVLPPEALGDARRVERFKEEARASAQLDHANIVRAYDFNETGKKLYIVMEFVDGVDLHRLVTRVGVMSHATALNAITQTCEGLVHAHERGVIHRDIKPSNLMLRSDGVVKVADMGLARIGWSDTDDPEVSTRLLGTADFAAPEQAINSKTVDARADIYSLGCTWYFLLTGQMPYPGDNLSQRLASHQTSPVPDVRSRRSDCPDVIAELLLRMMAKRPDQRPSSASDLLGQLQLLRSRRGESGLRHEHAAVIEVGSEAEIDDSVYNSTIDDSSGSCDVDAVQRANEVEEVEVIEEFGEFDFGSLPPLDTSGGGVLSDFLVHPSHDPLGCRNSAARPASAPPHPSATSASQKKRSDWQLVMLGIGLAFAVIALVLVVGIAAYTISSPFPQAAPKIKSIEHGNQERVILVK